MTTQRDRHGRWISTKVERTMTMEKAREARRNFYVGESKEHCTFSIASADASPLHGEFLSQSTERRRSIVEPSFCRGANAVFERNRNRVLVFKAVTIIDSTQADVFRERQQRDRVISSRVVLRWKETDIGHKARPDGACMVSRIPTFTRSSAVVQRQRCRPSTLHFKSWRQPLPRAPWQTERRQ